MPALKVKVEKPIKGRGSKNNSKTKPSAIKRKVKRNELKKQGKL